MKMPGSAFLRERRALAEFEALPGEWRQVVVYSEGAGDWPHIGPVVLALVRDHERRVTYVSSDPGDPGLAVNDENLRGFMIGTGTHRTILFARLRCANFVLTLPDLGSMWLKRSVYPVHYVYLFHSLNSTHTSYRWGAFDHYDTVLCVGPHHVDEIRKHEALRGLSQKTLVEHGSVKLDAVLVDVAAAASRPRETPGQVLVAPSWGDSSLIERPIGVEMLAALVGSGVHTVLRLHPMTTRRLPGLVDEILRRFADTPLFSLDADMRATGSWIAADVMISDWSGAASEYAFSLGRPVIYVDTPQKLNNARWQETDAPAFEREIRTQIGAVVPEDAGAIVAATRDALGHPAATSERIFALRERSVFNVGRSVAVAADYLAALRGAVADA